MKKMLLIVVVMCLVVPAGIAHAVLNPIITGTVADSQGNPIEGACVEASNVDSSGDDAFTVTDRFGLFFLPADPGSYRVRFSSECWSWPSGNGPTFVTEWYKDAAAAVDAQVIMLAEDQVFTLEATVSLGATITGTIVNDWGGRAWGTCAVAYLPDGPPFEWYSSEPVRFEGSFSILGIAPGEYVLAFYSCDEVDYLTEWWRDSADEASALRIVVEGEETIGGIRAELAEGGRIEGLVTTDKGAPSAYPSVIATNGTDQYWGWGREDGTYSIHALPPGTYKVKFCRCIVPRGGTGAETWFGGATEAEATPIEVEAGRYVLGIDGVIPSGPGADLAITSLRVDPVRLQTDAGPVGNAPNHKTVSIDVSNLGDRSGQGYLEVYARAKSNGSANRVGFAPLALAVNGERSFTFDWNAAGSVGDIEIEACVYPDGADTDLRNNVRREGTFSLVGGTGYGFGPQIPLFGGYDPCDYYLA